jgi:uncharacterized membrane protein YukC
MDTIDITSSEFSLGNGSNSNLLQGEKLNFNINDYLIYIYLAVGVIILGILTFLIYKFYINKSNKSKQVSFQERNEDFYIEKNSYKK